MKKIFTILLTVALASASFAQSFNKKQAAQTRSQISTSINRTSHLPFMGKRTLSTKDVAVVNNLMAINYGSISEIGGDYALQFMLDTNIVFAADVITPADNKIAGNYVLDSAVYVAGENDTVFVGGTLVITYVETNADGTWTYNAVATITELGGQERNFDFNENVNTIAIDMYAYYMYIAGYGSADDMFITLRDAPAPDVYDTVSYTFTNARMEDYSDIDGSFQFAAASADSADAFILCYFGNGVPTGSFTFDDVDLEYSYIYINGEEADIVDCNFTVTAITNGYKLEGLFYCYNGICYNVTVTYTENGSESISIAQVAQVSLYPNPVSSKLNVVAEGVQEIQVIDMMGQVVLRQANAGAIDMSSLSNGAYIVRTVTAAGVSTQKVIKK